MVDGYRWIPKAVSSVTKKNSLLAFATVVLSWFATWKWVLLRRQGIDLYQHQEHPRPLVENDDLGNAFSADGYSTLRGMCTMDRLPPLPPHKVRQTRSSRTNRDVEAVADLNETFFTDISIAAKELQWWTQWSRKCRRGLAHQHGDIWLHRCTFRGR